jgi:hypothetical protein
MQYLNTKFNLTEYFVPTADKQGEIRKAKIKNANLPYLQLMYNGDPYEPLRCLITKRNGWFSLADFGTGQMKKRFILDFNHIRQRCTSACQAGTSIDKGPSGDPSGWIRSRYLDPSYRGPNYSYVYRQKERELDVFELMTIMPITSEYHSYVTQDSAKSDITLLSFEKSTWAWCLQNKQNFNETKQLLSIKHFDWVEYDWFIDHLSNIDHQSIRMRLTAGPI